MEEESVGDGARLVPIPTVQGRREAGHIPRLRLAQHPLELDRAEVMAFFDNDLPVVRDEVRRSSRAARSR